MSEEALLEGVRQIKIRIKNALNERDMSQVELSEMMHENVQQVNKAIAGDMQPKSIELRKKIYKILDIK